MSYTALYRKYRPRSFCDVIGQEHITATLTNQIKADRISHAYLFTGSRGTGKTTCAKIFAKAVNCRAPADGSPCGNCAVCKALDDPANIDILEIDAASNNKVDEVREIRERVKYLPVNGRFKVYIVDEVHMLTDSAFNALLKTLEEPPAHVIFILATTEAHKLPATILSRCMRFDFRLVGAAELSALVKKVYGIEQKPFEPEAADYIAGAAEGSVRDCLSIADMCLNYADGGLTYRDVLSVLGAADRSRIAELFDAICAGDTGGVFLKIDAFANAGKSMALLAKDLAKYARDLLAIKAGGAELVTDTRENLAKMRVAAEGLGAELLIYIITEFSRIDAELRYSVSPRIVLETAAVRAARLSGEDYAALSERVRRLEEGLGNETNNEKRTIRDAAESKITNYNVQSTKADEFVESDLQIAPPKHQPINIHDETKISSEIPRSSFLAPHLNQSPSTHDAVQFPTQSVEPAAKSALGEDAESVWGRLLTHFRKARNMSLYSLLGEHTDYAIAGRELVITAGDDKFLRFCEDAAMAELNRALTEIGAPLAIRVEKQSSGVDMDKEIERLRKLTGLEPNIER